MCDIISWKCVFTVYSKHVLMYCIMCLTSMLHHKSNVVCSCKCVESNKSWHVSMWRWCYDEVKQALEWSSSKNKRIYWTYKGKTLTVTEIAVPSETSTSGLRVCIFTHADTSGCSINTHQSVAWTFKHVQ